MENIEKRDYEIKVIKKWYKKENSDEVKFSLSLKIKTMGGYMFASVPKGQYGALVRFANEHTDLIEEFGSETQPKIIKVNS